MRETVIKALITLLLTGMATVAFQCGKYAFFTFPDQLEDQLKRSDLELKSVQLKSERGKKFYRICETALSTIDDHLTPDFENLRRSSPFNRNDKNRVRLHKLAEDRIHTLDEISAEAQTVESDGYFINNPFKETQLRAIDSYIAVWTLVSECTLPDLDAVDVRNCNKEFLRRNHTFERAINLARHQLSEEETETRLLWLEQQKSLVAVHRDQRNVRRLNLLAHLGLAVSTSLYFLLFYLLFGTFKKHSAAVDENASSSSANSTKQVDVERAPVIDKS